MKCSQCGCSSEKNNSINKINTRFSICSSCQKRNLIIYSDNSLTYFKKEEIKYPLYLNSYLVWLMNQYRVLFNAPFRINVDYAPVGHSDKSYHGLGLAIDGKFITKNIIKSKEIIGRLHLLWSFGGMGVYFDWSNPNHLGLHLDLGPKRRWMRLNKKYIKWDDKLLI